MKLTHNLDSTNSINYISNFLDQDSQNYLADLIASTKLHQPTLKIFGNSPKFLDTTFAPANNTAPSKHYRQALITPQISTFSDLVKTSYNQHFPNTYSKHFNCNLVHYSPDFPKGGSRGKHQDNPDKPINLVLIYSIGQDRTLTFYKDNRKIYRLTLQHNSLVAMTGSTFQKTYFHQLDPLKKGIVPENRWSFNTRFI